VSLIGVAAAPLRSMNALVRPAGSVLRPVTGLQLTAVPRLVVQLADDVHSMAISTRELTETVRQLAQINQRVSSMEEEVTRMRAAVESMGEDVLVIRETTQPLARVAARLSRRRRPASA